MPNLCPRLRGHGDSAPTSRSCARVGWPSMNRRLHFKHSIDQVDAEGDILEQLAGVEDYLPAKVHMRLR